MGRIASLSPDVMSPRQRELYNQITNGPRQGVRGPFAVWVKIPSLAERLEPLGNYLRFESGLPNRLIELAILVTAKFWRSEFVSNSHAPLALQAGLSNEIVKAIERGETPPLDALDEKAVFDFVETLLQTKTTSDSIWLNAMDAIGEAGLINLIGLVGYYGLVCMTVSATQLDLD